jgi:hypothetical protein
MLLVRLEQVASRLAQPRRFLNVFHTPFFSHYLVVVDKTSTKMSHGSVYIALLALTTLAFVLAADPGMLHQTRLGQS